MSESTNPIVAAVQNTCLLAKVSFTALGLTRTDKRASQEVAEDKNAVAGAARVVVSRLAGVEHHHRDIVATQTRIRQTLVELSMPYGNEDGWRLLPTEQFETLLQRIAPLKKHFDEKVQKLRNEAGEIIRSAKENLGSLDVDVPTEDELGNAYTMTTEFQPIPDGKQLRGLPPSTQTKMTTMIERRIENAAHQATADTLTRLVGPLKHFVERMQIYEDRERRLDAGEKVGRAGTFNASVLDNLKSLHAVLGSFNITGDPRLQELTDMLASVAATDVDTLRKDTVVRTEATKRAREALARLDSWITPPEQKEAA